MREFNSLLRTSRTGMAVGALALGGLAAGLGSMGGVVGGALGASAAFALGTTGVIGCGGGLGYLGLTKSPKDFRAILLGFGGLVIGGVAGGVLGRYGGEALRQLAGGHGGLAGATAGMISAAPVGMLVGGVLHIRKNLKEHPELYPNLLKAKTDASQAENPKK